MAPALLAVASPSGLQFCMLLQHDSGQPAAPAPRQATWHLARR